MKRRVYGREDEGRGWRREEMRRGREERDERSERKRRGV